MSHTNSSSGSSSGSHFVTAELAAQAVGMALPLIERAMQHSFVGESGFLFIVVMQPTLTPANSSFEEAILYEHAIGDRSKWDADYAGFAHAKTRISWNTGLDSHVVQTQRPHLLEPDNTVLWGSVAIEGIVVGASGANACYDEAFAGVVAMCLRALVKDRRERYRGGLFLTASQPT
ncbi:MAG: hypothetical protein JWL63_1983 [Rhodocyclales bacterium]|nr:hypothetical protein [Rhodocyclales bacterium]